MRGNDFLDKMELVDPAYVEAADALPGKKPAAWKRWGALAACLCVVLGSAAAYQTGMFETGGINAGDDALSGDSEECYAYAFVLGEDPERLYYPISFEERKAYGLVPEDATGLTEENTYQITEADLGEPMGIIDDYGPELLKDCQVYHFARFPEMDAICIVDTAEGYDFYVCTWLDINVAVGGSFDRILEAYRLPGALERMEILKPDFTHFYDVEDAAVAGALLEILAGKTNHGLEANERRFAQVWQETYGNDAVFYSEESGHCVYRSIDDGTPDKAHELWTEGERIIRITTVEGYQLEIDYFPAVRIFACGDGYYEISENEVKRLNTLLEIQEIL